MNALRHIIYDYDNIEEEYINTNIFIIIINLYLNYNYHTINTI